MHKVNSLFLYMGVACVFFCSLSCAHPSPAEPVFSAAASRAPERHFILNEDLRVFRLADNIFVHVSMFDLPDLGPYPSNGLILLAANGAVMVDTPWTNAQTAQLVDWFENKFATKVRELIVTHAHDDRMGGINEIISRNIGTHAFTQTAQLALADGKTSPQHLFGKQQVFNMLGENIETFYPGPGHSSDNIVVWLPRYKTLFGGCLLRELASEGIGAADPAAVPVWKSSVERVIQRYPQVELVIPGHGQPGGRDLLLHTQEVLEKRIAAGNSK